MRYIIVILFVFFTSISVVKADNATIDVDTKAKNELPDFLQYRPYGSTITDYSIPHVTKNEILDWAMQHAADLMSFDARNANEHFKQIQSFFVRSGWEDFTNYITRAKLKEEVIESNYALITIVNGRAIIKREGPFRGIYRWVIEMPVLMTFYKLDKYGNPKQNISATARGKLSITITRVAKGGGRTKVAISKWKMISN